MMKKKSNRTHLLGRLELDTDFGPLLEDTRVRLMQEIDRHGSISQAAKHVPMSYKAAWDAVDAMNNLAEYPLFDRATGGKHGGGTRLTDYGRRLVELHQVLSDEYLRNLDQLAERMRDPENVDFRELQRMIRRMAIKTSARNQFVGLVSGLREGEIDFEVRMRIDDENELCAVITHESADLLKLRIGSEVHAFVKSSSILLLTDRAGRTSARNHLWGTVNRIHNGPVNSQVTLELSGGRTVSAVITRDSVDSLGICEGNAACAIFKASSVILATFD